MSKPPPPPPGPVLNVTTANTTVTGTVNNETINALGANDTIIAGPGYEYLNAGGANDTLEGAIGSATFTGLTGSSNSTLVALPSLTATLPGVEIYLDGAGAYAGVTITGTVPYLVTPTHQQAYGSPININNLIVSNNGDNILGASYSGSTLTVNGNGNNLLEGNGGNDTLIANGSGSNMFWDAGGTNRMTGGSGNNYYYEEVGRPASKYNPAEYYNNTITNFNTATDTLEFQITNTFTDHRTTTIGISEAPTSWTLISVNGVASLRAVLGDGVSTLTLLGVTDPSLIHMEGVDNATQVTTQLPDVPLAGAAQFASAMAGMGGGAAGTPAAAGSSPILAHPVLTAPRMAALA